MHQAQLQLVLFHQQDQVKMKEELCNSILDIRIRNFFDEEKSQLQSDRESGGGGADLIGNNDYQDFPATNTDSTFHYFIEEADQVELKVEKLSDLDTAELCEEFLEDEYIGPSSSSTTTTTTAGVPQEVQFDADFFVVEELIEDDVGDQETLEQQHQLIGQEELKNIAMDYGSTQQQEEEEETMSLEASLSNNFVQMTQELAENGNSTVIKYRGITIGVLRNTTRKTSNDFQKHITLEKGECPQCRRHNSNVKSECAICNAFFSSQQILDQHYVSIHNIDRFPMKMCRSCGKLFEIFNKGNDKPPPPTPSLYKNLKNPTTTTNNNKKDSSVSGNESLITRPDGANNPPIKRTEANVANKSVFPVNRPKSTVNKPKQPMKYSVSRRAFRLPATKFLKRLQSFQAPEHENDAEATEPNRKYLKLNK